MSTTLAGTMAGDLTWLPERANWSELLEAARGQAPAEAIGTFQLLAASRMNFIRTGKLDRAFSRLLKAIHAPALLPTVRVAMLGSATLSHLLPGIRMGALRRGLIAETYEGAYGSYRQEIADSRSGLHQFRPDVVCLALDAEHLAGAEGASAEGALAMLRQCWREIRDRYGCVVLQQTVLPRLLPVLGNNESRDARSSATIVQQINHGLREVAEADGVYLLSVDTWAAVDGLSLWHDAALWYSSKHEVHPRVSHLYGDQVGRVLAALRGRSGKCMVLDLDNTLWGGVIGDDGVDGIVLGQGTATGEAHLALQRYARLLSERGILLAVCSKNDKANALAAFDRHPEMLLRREDIACFVANWQDKAENLRVIAETLNLGLDSLVFVDDTPAERALIRRELPMVFVPELPEDVSEYVRCIADSGCFEALDVTAEDRKRTSLYRANADREVMRGSATDMGSFLEGLKMRLTWGSFDLPGLKRIVQLMNKTNQFNLTTERHTEAGILAMMHDPDVRTMQLRLADVYGDNGVIGLVVGRRTPEHVLQVETWLMSCRVLGRQIEDATLNLLAERARELGCTRVLGQYRPTAKNGMVQQHYARLGFALSATREDGSTDWLLPLDSFVARAVPMAVQEGTSCKPLPSIAS